MKIEKINDNQIRCTLTREDLNSRHMKLSELAYGSEKARALFNELMEKAQYECGFDAEDIPVMIEAVPLSSEAILLQVTKIDQPEELDTRFSRFSEDYDYFDEEDDEDFDFEEVPAKAAPPKLNTASANGILDMFSKMLDDAMNSNDPAKIEQSELDITKMFVFNSLDEILELAPMITAFYCGDNSLYKSPSGQYYLVVSKSTSTPEVYNKVCNILAEYGNQHNMAIGADSYMAEHYTVIAVHDALAKLSQI